MNLLFCLWSITCPLWWPGLPEGPWGHLGGVCCELEVPARAKILFRCLSPGPGAGNTSPSSGGELSSTTLLCQSSTATEVDVFNFGICNGNLQGGAGALEAKQEQEHHELAAKARKSISPESFMRPWIFWSQLSWHWDRNTDYLRKCPWLEAQSWVFLRFLAVKFFFFRGGVGVSPFLLLFLPEEWSSGVISGS